MTGPPQCWTIPTSAIVSSGPSRAPGHASVSGPRSSAESRSIFATYIANNLDSIPNYGERWRYGEHISTAFVESTVNVVIDKRMSKRQQMQWTKQGAHRLLQIRTRTLDGTLRPTFEGWFPGLAANDDARGDQATA